MYQWGSLGTLNLSTDCETTFTNPTRIPFTWQFADVYNVVETVSHRILIACRANWRWSKCSPLVPGTSFQAEVKGNQIWVEGLRANSEKKVQVKYTILAAEIK